MLIRHVESADQNQTDENRFIAYDDVGLELGRAEVSETQRDMLFPSRPHHLQIQVDCEDEALYALFGAATARAMQLARLMPDTPARIFTEVSPKDIERIERLQSQGYKDDDGIMRMTRSEIRKIPFIKPIPSGLVVIKDYLIDELESRFFIERYNALFATNFDDTWLAQLKKKKNFCRFLVAAPDGLAGELLIWSEDACGVVGVVHTPPHWQRKGIASHLLEQALQYWAERGIKSACFDVWLRLRGAMQLASTCGFRPDRPLMKYPGIDVEPHNPPPRARKQPEIPRSF